MESEKTAKDQGRSRSAGSGSYLKLCYNCKIWNSGYKAIIIKTHTKGQSC